LNPEIQTILHRENMKLASIQKRATAYFIDELLISLVLILSLWDSISQNLTTEEIIVLTNTFIIEFMIIKIGYQAFFTMQFGASIGKLLMKIKVVEIKTLDNPNVIVALNRGIFRVISEMFLYLGFLWGMLDKSSQTWHDKTSKTMVVNV